MSEILTGYVTAERRDGTEMGLPHEGTAEEIKTYLVELATEGWRAEWTEDKPENAPPNWTPRRSMRWPINHGPKVVI